MKFCPKCNRLTEYDSYFDKYYCTSCSWRSEKINEGSMMISIKRRTASTQKLTLAGTKLAMK